MIFKVIAKGIYDMFDTDYIPFIGQGTRPSGAHSCSSFISAPLMPATSFGMPSGHSQLAWFFTVYACLSIIYKWKNKITIELTKKKVILSCIALIVLAITISYSRVSIEGCHTTGQVVIGGLIGSVIALTAFWIKTLLTSANGST
jgi:membrane-associated phospholipid phosphatase